MRIVAFLAGIAVGAHLRALLDDLNALFEGGS